MLNDRARGRVRAASIALLAALGGCSGDDGPVDTRRLAAARRTWEAAKLRDYDLEWATSGAVEGRYRVEVRAGKVASVREVTPDGRVAEVRPAEPTAFGVDGLFAALDADRAQALGPAPFGRAAGTAAQLRFEPDAELGYPRRYRRDLDGGAGSIALDVLRLDARVGGAAAPAKSAP